jgi:hypothetical protein
MDDLSIGELMLVTAVSSATIFVCMTCLVAWYPFIKAEALSWFAEEPFNPKQPQVIDLQERRQRDAFNAITRGKS